MMFFTREIISGEFADDEVDTICKSYQQHIERILVSSPKEVAELAQTNLHDGLIRRAVVDHGVHVLSLALRCGDLQVGYFDVDIQYSGVTLTPQQLQVLARRARDRRTEILADEIDTAADGPFVHRLLFWPDDELEIVFTGLTIEKQDQPSREVANDEKPYIEIT
jgi:hypothetical protein